MKTLSKWVWIIGDNEEKVWKDAWRSAWKHKIQTHSWRKTRMNSKQQHAQRYEILRNQRQEVNWGSCKNC